MFKLFREAFILLLTAIYVKCRGESTTRSVYTEKSFIYTYTIESEVLKFISKEYKHETIFKRWYLGKQIRYAYLVTVVSEDNGYVTLVDSVPVPILCMRRFAGTTLPHRLAVAECFYRFAKPE